jgi:hypothetical protein
MDRAEFDLGGILTTWKAPTDATERAIVARVDFMVAVLFKWPRKTRISCDAGVEKQKMMSKKIK